MNNVLNFTLDALYGFCFIVGVHGWVCMCLIQFYGLYL